MAEWLAVRSLRALDRGGDRGRVQGARGMQGAGRRVPYYFFFFLICILRRSLSSLLN